MYYLFIKEDGVFRQVWDKNSVASINHGYFSLLGASGAKKKTEKELNRNDVIIMKEV